MKYFPAKTALLFEGEQRISSNPNFILVPKIALLAGNPLAYTWMQYIIRYFFFSFSGFSEVKCVVKT